MNPSISELTNKDKEVITGLASNGIKLIKTFLNKVPEKIQSSTLDKTFLCFLDDNRQHTNQEIAEGLGAVFGELLVQDFSMSWKAIEDEYGREYALIHEETGSVVFPINSIWKRLEPEIVREPVLEPMWNTVNEHLKKGTKD